MEREKTEQKTEQRTEQKKDQKIEVKEKLDQKQLRSLLSNWIKAIDDEKDFELEVKGKTRRVPHSALSDGRLNVEVEWKNGENEFEIELKWPGRPEDTLLKQ